MRNENKNNRKTASSHSQQTLVGGERPNYYVHSSLEFILCETWRSFEGVFSFWRQSFELPVVKPFHHIRDNQEESKNTFQLFWCCDANLSTQAYMHWIASLAQPNIQLLLSSTSKKMPTARFIATRKPAQVWFPVKCLWQNISKMSRALFLSKYIFMSAYLYL